MNRIARPSGRVNETIFFALIQCAYWSATSVVYAFIIMFLKENGFSDAMCGITSGLLSGMSILIHPIMGYVSDTYITGKKMLLFCFVIAIPFTLVLPYTVSLGGVFIVAVTILSLFDNYQYSIIDAWIIKLKPTHPDLDFAKVRSFGSLGYGLTALVFGNVIAKFGFNMMFYAHSVLLFIALLLMLPLPEAPCLNQKKIAGEGKLSFMQVMKILVKNKKYMIFMVSVCFYQFATRSTSSFLSMIVSAAGGNSADLGVATFACAFFEFPVMLGLSVIIRRGAKMPYLFLASLLLGVVRLYVVSLPLGVTAVVITQLVNAISVGTHITVFTQYISSITPRNITATATTIGTALTFGTGGVFGNFIGGFIIEGAGIYTYIRICTIMMFIAAVVFLPNVLACRQESKEPQVQ